MITPPLSFARDVESRDTYLFPAVQIEHPDIVGGIWISTNIPNFGSTWAFPPDWKPILLNIPSIKESIDIETKKYKISNVTLDISNVPYEGQRFSEIVGINSLINAKCRIFWCSQTTTGFNFVDTGASYTDANGFEVYFGTIRRYEHDDDKVRLIVEDLSQAKIDRELTSTLGVGDNIPDKYKNKTIPIIYGKVDRSPCVFDGKDIIYHDSRPSSWQTLGIRLEPIDPKVNVIPDVYGDEKLPGLLIGNEGNLSYILEIPEEDLGTYIPPDVDTLTPNTEGDAAYDLSDSESLGITTTRQWEYQFNTNTFGKIELLSNPLITAGVLQCVDIYTPDIQIIRVLDSVEEPINLFPGFEAFFEAVSSQTNIYEPTFHTVIHNTNDKNGHPRFKIKFGLESNSDYVKEHTVNGVEYVGMHIKYVSMNGFLLPARNSGYPGWGYGSPNGTGGHMHDRAYVAFSWSDGWHELGADQVSLRPDEVGLSMSSISLVPTNLFGYPQYVATSFANDSYWYDFNQSQLVSELGINIETWIDGGTSLAWFNALNETADLYFYDWAGIGSNTKNKQYIIYIRHQYKGVLETPLTGDLGLDSSLKISGTINRTSAKALVDIQKIGNKEFYVNAFGKGVHTPTSDSPDLHTIFKMIIDDLGYLALFSASVGDYSDWLYDFTINKKKNAKKLIQEIASASPYIPRFNNMGKFVMDQIPTEGGTSSRTILSDDCIDFSFSRTKPEQMYTKVIVKFKWDYTSGKFSRSYTNSDPNFPFEHYGLPDNPDDPGSYISTISDGGTYDPHAETTFIIDDNRGKYIRSGFTAARLSEFMLDWYKHPHLKMKVILPLKYINLEIGDIVDFDELLGGIAPYGIDYTADSVIANHQQAYNTFIITSTNKTLEYVEIEATQLHKITQTDYDPDSRVWGLGEVAPDCYGTCEGIANSGQACFTYNNCDCSGNADGNTTTNNCDGCGDGYFSFCTGCTNPDACNYGQNANGDLCHSAITIDGNEDTCEGNGGVWTGGNCYQAINCGYSDNANICDYPGTAPGTEQPYWYDADNDGVGSDDTVYYFCDGYTGDITCDYCVLADSPTANYVTTSDDPCPLDPGGYDPDVDCAGTCPGDPGYGAYVDGCGDCIGGLSEQQVSNTDGCNVCYTDLEYNTNPNCTPCWGCKDALALNYNQNACGHDEALCAYPAHHFGHDCYPSDFGCGDNNAPGLCPWRRIGDQGSNPDFINWICDYYSWGCSEGTVLAQETRGIFVYDDYTTDIALHNAMQNYYLNGCYDEDSDGVGEGCYRDANYQRTWDQFNANGSPNEKCDYFPLVLYGSDCRSQCTEAYASESVQLEHYLNEGNDDNHGNDVKIGSENWNPHHINVPFTNVAGVHIDLPHFGDVKLIPNNIPDMIPNTQNFVSVSEAEGWTDGDWSDYDLFGAGYLTNNQVTNNGSMRNLFTSSRLWAKINLLGESGSFEQPELSPNKWQYSMNTLVIHSHHMDYTSALGYTGDPEVYPFNTHGNDFSIIQELAAGNLTNTQLFGLSTKTTQTSCEAVGGTWGGDYCYWQQDANLWAEDYNVEDGQEQRYGAHDYIVNQGMAPTNIPQGVVDSVDVEACVEGADYQDWGALACEHNLEFESTRGIMEYIVDNGIIDRYIKDSLATPTGDDPVNPTANWHSSLHSGLIIRVQHNFQLGRLVQPDGSPDEWIEEWGTTFYQDISYGNPEQYLEEFECDDFEGKVRGDLSGDGILNVLDVVLLVNCILEGNCDQGIIEAGVPRDCWDMNGDNTFNILDIVTLVNCVLDPYCG
tara:strand:+ start:422 stop:5764 length:5343 start_codon:yes stop_codon:yes gene_type:complete